MSTAVAATFAIPDDWPDAAVFFSLLHHRPEIGADEWKSIAAWLLHTPFNEQNWLAGDAGATLIRDRAPRAIRVAVLRLLTSSTTHIRFRAIIRGQPADQHSPPIRLHSAST